MAARAAGAAIWMARWGAWPRRASLVIIVPAFPLIALANSYGGPDLHTYSAFSVIAFVWIRLAQPPGTSLAVAPLTVAACLLPLLLLPGSAGPTLPSAVLTILACGPAGEGIAWSVVRLEPIKRALHQERYRAGQLPELGQMKDAFLSAVSHKLRTPITIWRGHHDVLDADDSARRVRAVKKLVVDEPDRTGRVVDDLTTPARADDQVTVECSVLNRPGRGATFWIRIPR